MLSNSGITVLSFANKVVKVQPQKFVRSLYNVPRTSQYKNICRGSKLLRMGQFFSLIIRVASKNSLRSC